MHAATQGGVTAFRGWLGCRGGARRQSTQVGVALRMGGDVGQCFAIAANHQYAACGAFAHRDGRDAVGVSLAR